MTNLRYCPATVSSDTVTMVRSRVATNREELHMFTYDETLTALKAIVAEDPYRTNGTCELFEWKAEAEYDCNKPVCVVGNVVHRLGVACSVAYDNSGFIDSHDNKRAFGENFDDAAIVLLRNVQTKADNGGIGNVPWGMALDEGVQDAMHELLD